VNSVTKSVLNNINLKYFTVNERGEGKGRKWERDERDLKEYRRKKGRRQKHESSRNIYETFL
jgi:hypothetical protein